MYNGRPSWTMADSVPRYKRKAIWWSQYKFWAIGDFYYTGSSTGGSIDTCYPTAGTCPPTNGPPYTAGIVWQYYDGVYWKETTTEVIVECIRCIGK